MTEIEKNKNITFAEKFPEFKKFREEDGLLFWNGYLISTSTEGITEEKLTELEQICNVLINRGLNPEEMFNFNPTN